MEPKIISLEQEVSKLEQQGSAMQESGDVFELQVGVAVVEAVNKAREVLAQAQADAKAARDVVAGLTGIQNLPESMDRVMQQLAATEEKLNATAAAYKEGSAEQQQAFSSALSEHTKSLQKVFADVLKSQADAEARQEKVLARALKASVDSVQNLIQELEDGVKVSIENQEKLPVVGFSQGKVRGVDQAVPVMLVDENGKPTKAGSGAASASFVGPEVYQKETQRYSIANIENGTDRYFGYLAANGNWYIMVIYADLSVYYARGASDYDSAWLDRTGLSYDLYNNVF